MTALSIALISTVSAQQVSGAHMHAAMQAPANDARQPVQFPAEMQTSFLGNMRDHMQTINGIVQALAAGDYAAASRTAAERLGLDSPSAAGCKPKAAATHDSTAAMTALARVTQNCVACHSTYRLR